MTKTQKDIKVGKISRADVAHYLLTEAENPQNINQYFYQQVIKKLCKLTNTFIINS